MTVRAERDQVLLGVGAGVAAKLFVVNLKIRHRASALTPPAIATQNLHAVHLGQMGGKARSRKLSSEERTAIAQKAARARWAKIKRKAEKIAD